MASTSAASTSFSSPRRLGHKGFYAADSGGDGALGLDFKETDVCIASVRTTAQLHGVSVQGSGPAYLNDANEVSVLVAEIA